MKHFWKKSAPFALTSLLLSLALLTACGNAPIPSSSSSTPSNSLNLPAEEVPTTASSAKAGTPDVTEEGYIPELPAAEAQEAAAMKMQVQVGGRTFSATLENNAAAKALAEMVKAAPVEIQMRDYSGFEKVGSLGASLPAEDKQTTTQAGDIVLYTGNQIVMFYGSNSWGYTRLGRVDDLTGWEEALGTGNVTVTFSINEVV